MKAYQFLFLFAISIFINLQSSAQLTGNEVLITIDDENVSVDEFLRVYKKNNPVEGGIDHKDLVTYLDLYIDFRLKVKEATTLGLDTAASFQKELEGYRKQLAQPYFIDEDVNEFLLKQAYERKLEDIRASHILIKVDKDASPEDTLAAYNKLKEVKQSILDGEDFGVAAARISDDPSAKDMEASQQRPARKGNHGDLGYFTVFDMVYPFENGAYATPKGNISVPVRTEYGYHIINVTDRHPAQGQVQVAHVYVTYPKTNNPEDSLKARNKIFDAYEKLLAGTSFNEVVKKYSEDKGSVDNEGKLPWFGVNRMVPDFIVAIRPLSNPGDYTEPFTTPFGWHIAMLIERKPVGSFDDEKMGLRNRLAKDRRSKLSEETILNRIKEEYGFKEYPKAKTALLAKIDSTLLLGEWKAETVAGMNKTIFSIGDRKYSQYEFAEYLAGRQHKRIKSIDAFFNDQYKMYVEDAVVAYEDNKLEGKYPEFKMLVQEYHDGILLFDLTDQKVWSMAVRDTVGLKAYHESHRGNYMWEKRLNASIYKIIEPDKVNLDSVRAFIATGATPEEVLSKFNHEKEKNIAVKSGDFQKNDNPSLTSVKWKKGISQTVFEDGLPIIVNVYKVLKATPKTLDEARGLITADYQNYLEDQWISELKEKYTVTVNQEVLGNIK